MTDLHVDSHLPDADRRTALYDGALLVLPPTAAGVRLAALARRLCEEAFAPHDPPTAQDHLPVERYVEILARLKPGFIHHPEAKRLIHELLLEVGADPDETHFDVPRLRTMASGDYLRAGLAYQFHAHRDTWFSAPMAQLNWWLPVWPVTRENAMAFFPRYFGHPVANSSSIYDYDRWVAEGRQAAASQVTAETRAQPEAQEPLDLEHDLRPLCPPGGVIIFSAAHLHGTVPNTSGVTRFSIDFRTVHAGDLAMGRGAVNVDSACTGTTLGDFHRATDLAPLPADIVARYRSRAA